MPSLPTRFVYMLRRWRVARAGVQLPQDACVGPGVLLRLGQAQNQRGRIELTAGLCLEAGVVLDAWGGSIRLGERVFLGPHAVIYGQGGVVIGDDCLISMHARILSSEHTIPALDRRIRWEPDILKPTQLGHDVWIGAGATILGGVNIGSGCVIGAGAVVTRDLPPGSIAVGVPAGIVGQRAPTTAPRLEA
jgi:acetyltransferase-like isoleucine patch superfamily enzyme